MMRTFKICPVSLLLLGLIFFVLSCGSNRNTSSIDNFTELRELVDSGEFVIENQWALPLRGGNVNLIGNANSIRFEGDSVNVYLPYFGVRHAGGGYGSEGGIKYEGIAENLKISTNEADEEIEIRFEADQGGENLEFFISLFPEGDASTSVTSSQRDAISYRGQVKALPEEDENEQ